LSVAARAAAATALPFNHPDRSATPPAGKQAAGWYQIIRNGSVAAYYAALADPNSAAPADLYPGNAVFDFLDEKKFPTPE